MSKHIAIIPIVGDEADAHQAVWDLVGGEKRSFLFYRDGSSLLISSSTAFPGSEESEDSYAPGTRLAYKTMVDAVHRHHGKQRRFVMDHELSTWFEERYQGKGFDLAGVPRVVDITDINFAKKDGTPVHYHAVTFEGTLTVSDTNLFRELLHKGNLRGKSYGLGLFLVKPVK
jgi:hypothetical protein